MNLQSQADPPRAVRNACYFVFGLAKNAIACVSDSKENKQLKINNVPETQGKSNFLVTRTNPIHRKTVSDVAKTTQCMHLPIWLRSI